MWFQHDGAPAHFSRTARDYLNEVFPGRWVGRGGLVSWPPRSPDMNPLDFYVWGHMKREVYGTEIPNREELWRRVEASAARVRNNPGVMERVRQSLMRRAAACIEQGGRNFEHLL
ncbi:hypothetical protein Pcinc_014594 [Petrolisthes cinctipes]|uniref:Transposable element Tc3 transposase n=1 Tax=Petrolisthes cinctipes TaxID=88211 RepID=A0AAE1KQK2_PETCI|nr:hypothetical protein Pcinc_014594 [Petrolisthes cinctipes]